MNLFRSRAAFVACLWLAAVSPALADNTTEASWPAGRFTVDQVNSPNGRFCRFLGDSEDGKAAYGLARLPSGITQLWLMWNDTSPWAAGNASVTIDGMSYSVPMRPASNDARVLIADTDDDFRHAIYNGISMRIWLNVNHVTTFSLTGTATAITILNQCGAGIAGGGQQVAAPVPLASPGRSEIAMLRSEGGLWVDGSVNGVLPVRFMLDSGATSVVLPRSMIQRLVNAGTLNDGDARGTVVSTLADGSQRRSFRYRLRSLTVGGRTATDVICSMGEDGSTILLGQSFLDKFPSWSVDNRHGLLILN